MLGNLLHHRMLVYGQDFYLLRFCYTDLVSCDFLTLEILRLIENSLVKLDSQSGRVKPFVFPPQLLPKLPVNSLCAECSADDHAQCVQVVLTTVNFCHACRFVFIEPLCSSDLCN